MKKLGFLLFVLALAVGLLSATNCSVGNLKNMTSVQGSGNIKQENRSVSGFKKIEANGAVNMEIAVGNDFNVGVEADDNLLQYVKTEVSGDTLKIYNDNGISSSKKVNVKISLPELTKLDLNGASSANVANVAGDSFEIKANGASKVLLAGVVKTINIKANGASTVDAENLKAENADADSNGASTVTVAPQTDLKATASGASTIFYVGEPKNIKQDASGASSIKKK